MAARRMSPVAILGMQSRRAAIRPWVPLPDPGAPRNRMNTGAPALAWPAAELDSTFFHEAVVVPQQQVLLHLLHRIERDADDDEQGCAAEAERHIQPVADDDRQQRHDGEEDGAG